jgi:NADH dehydrogenase/NADH:ubiquinone oxidoreductase subunit G
VYNAIGRNVFPYLTIRTYSYAVTGDDGDGQLNPGESANLVLPTPTFVEENGCFINVNSRLQRSEKGLTPPKGIKPVWDWLEMNESAETLLKRFAKEILDKELDYEKIGSQGVEL